MYYNAIYYNVIYSLESKNKIVMKIKCVTRFLNQTELDSCFFLIIIV